MPNESILSVVRYSDPVVASQWLCRAFGFSVHRSADRLEGGLAYVVLRFGDDLVLVGSSDDDELFVEPGEVGDQSTRAYFVAAEEIDAHCARAVQAGATIEIAPRDKDGGRYYICRDLEGHLWCFGRPPPGIMLEVSQHDGGRRRSRLRKRLIASAVFVLATVGIGATLYRVEHPIAKSLTNLLASASRPEAVPPAPLPNPLPQAERIKPAAHNPTASQRAAEQQAEEEHQRRAAEAAQKAEAERQRQAAEAAQKAEAERQRLAAEAAQKAEAEQQRQAAEAAQKAEAERQRLAAEAEAEAAQKAEAERQRQAAEAARTAEEERQSQVAEAAEVARKADEERQRQVAESARMVEEERQRQAAEAARMAEEERLQQAAEAARKAEAERQRQAADAAQKAEEERQRLAVEAAQKAEAERQRQAAEAAQKAEAERQRLAVEAAQKAEEERQRQAAEAARIAKDAAEAKAQAGQEIGRRTLGLTVTPEDGARFLKRGRALLTTGDVTGARLFFERASNAGLADAAMELAETYDPATLTRLNVVGLAGDREQARAWYMRAQALGSSAATERLKSIGSQ